jgi:hypothetical protein
VKENVVVKETKSQNSSNEVMNGWVSIPSKCVPNNAELGLFGTMKQRQGIGSEIISIVRIQRPLPFGHTLLAAS